MKLSTAILRGCKMRPRQSFGVLYEGEDASCVMGALRDGWAGKSGSALEVISSRELQASERAGLSQKLWTELVIANNTHLFSREFLAECLRRKGL